PRAVSPSAGTGLGIPRCRQWGLGSSLGEESFAWRASFCAVRELWSGNGMTQVLAATSTLFRDRDLFIHDGSKLRRFRVSAPVQAVLFVILLALVAWASYATARLISTPSAPPAVPARSAGAYRDR